MNAFPSRWLAACVVFCFWLSSVATAQQWIKSGTSPTVMIGPFVDKVDGYTPQESLSIGQGDVRLSKEGGAFGQKNSTGAVSHAENGYYTVPLNATDTNTPGRLRVAVKTSTALPVWQDFMVVPASTYDALVGGSATLPANVTQWNSQNLGTQQQNGFPTVTIKNGTGTGEIATFEGALVRLLDKSRLAARGTVVSDPSPQQTVFTIAAELDTFDNTTNAYKDYVVRIIDTSSGSVPKPASLRRVVSSSVQVSETITLTIDTGPHFTIAEGDIVELYPPDLETLTRLPDATPGAANGLFIAGSNAATTVAGLTSTAGITITQSTTNGNGVSVTGNGTGSGLVLTRGGVSGDDFKLTNSDAPTLANVLWDEARSGHTTNGTFGQGVASVQGNVTGSVGSISGLTITDGRVNADVTHWHTTEVSTSQPGVPRVDVTHLLGSPVCD